MDENEKDFKNMTQWKWKYCINCTIKPLSEISTIHN